MFKKSTAYLRRNDEDFEVELEAMQLLRKRFLEVPFEEFVNIEALRQSISGNAKVNRYLISLGTRLDFGTDSYRYYMQYLRDEKTAEVADSDASHDIHTDFRGRCDIRNVHYVLEYAMGFNCLDEELDLEKRGYESDPGYVEETLCTELGKVQISGHKNTKGNYHGYCQIIQSDGAEQDCFFDDGKILARRIYYTNGVKEDVRGNPNIVVDPFANRKVYEVSEDNSGALDINETYVDRETAEEIFNILSGYSLEMSCVHRKTYPYDDEIYYETERDRCVPGLNMALLRDGKLWGVVLKCNGYNILPIDDAMYSLCNYWPNYAVELGGKFSKGELTVTLAKAL